MTNFGSILVVILNREPRGTDADDRQNQSGKTGEGLLEQGGDVSE